MQTCIRTALIVLCCATCLCIPHASWAARYQLTLDVENDALVLGRGSDKNYTSGLELAFFWNVPAEWYCGSESITPSGICRAGTLRSPLFKRLRFGLYFGQKIFTPENTQVRQVQRADRPYAGWLYLGFGVEYVRGPMRIYGALTLGFTGEMSGASQFQTWFHKSVLRQTTPKGWAHQIGSEVTVAGLFEIDYRFLQAQSAASTTHHWFDIGPRGFATLGTPSTCFGAGVRLRAGYIGQRLLSERVESQRFMDHFQLYVFADAQVKVVVRNDIVQGALMSSNVHTAPLQHFVPSARTGVSFRTRLADLIISFVFEGPEAFPGQDKPLHLFGQVQLNFHW